jgi:hypothetical protein
VEQLQPKRIDRSDLLTNSVFWAIHSYEQARADNWIEEFFHLSPDDHHAFWQQKFPNVVPGEPHLFPCYSFLLPLRDGYSASVEYEACPEDFGIAYYVHHRSWNSPILLSRYPSAYDWPPFRWEEAVMIAESVQDGAEGIRQAALPLLFPGVWLTKDDSLDQVRIRLRSAWADLRVVEQAHLDRMIPTMVEAQGIFEPWQYDANLGWVNNGWNYRNPKRSAPAMFERVKQFFAGVRRTTAG